MDAGLLELRPGEFVEGQDLVASTSGTDSDWVVKVIAKPIAPNQPLLYRFALPTANHVFLPGHRMMVQAQASFVELPLVTTP